jgi:hypothetical protein
VTATKNSAAPPGLSFDDFFAREYPRVLRLAWLLTRSAGGGVVDGSCRTFGHAVIVDRRGHTQYAVYVDVATRQWTGCVNTVPGETPDRGLGPARVDVNRLQHLAVTAVSAATPLAVVDAKAPEASAAQKRAAVTYVTGRAASEVARVTVDTDRGTIVASLADGYFAAWWPGNDGDTDAVHAYDSSGALLSTVDELTCTSITGLFSPRVSTVGYPPTGGCR